MPGATIAINSEQREGLYELVRNHPGSVGDLFDALERDKDLATAERPAALRGSPPPPKTRNGSQLATSPTCRRCSNP